MFKHSYSFFVLIFFCFFYSSTMAQFITKWQVSSGESITIPTLGGGYNYTVNWGDAAATITTGHTGNATSPVYTTGGIKTVTVSGDFPRIYFINAPDRLKIVSLDQWGSTPQTNMENAFYGCENLVNNANNVPTLVSPSSMVNTFRECEKFTESPIPAGAMNNWDVSGVTDMSVTFADAISFNADISNWNTANVENMEQMFSNAEAFNQDISSWNVEKVTDMTSMFKEAISFNQNLNTNGSSWNTISLTACEEMFRDAIAFNGSLAGWDLTSATSFLRMFEGAEKFNKDLSSWNTENINNMQEMFRNASAFNQDISSWNTEKVTNMSSMFRDAIKFNKNLSTSGSSWNTPALTACTYMFSGATDFNGTVAGWDLTGVTDLDFMFNRAVDFNQDLSSWDVGSVTDMRYCFAEATDFNGDLSNWSTSNVDNMSFMFNRASSFNRDVSTWNVDNVKTLQNTFANATSFNQDLSSWNTASVTDMRRFLESATSFDQDVSSLDFSSLPANRATNMLDHTAISIANYDAGLKAWKAAGYGPLSIGVDDLEYCDATAITARDNMITAGWSFNGDSECSRLPIELISFDATNKENSVVLEWQTATEINNDFFTIERSADARNWKTIAEVNGAGNSSELLSYISYDEKPLRGLAYYRLKQTDYDGKYSYSEIKSINRTKNTEMQISLSPNPAQNQISINTNESIAIYNVLGKNLSKQTPTISTTETNTTIDLSNLAQGMYFVRIGTETVSFYKK